MKILKAFLSISAILLISANSSYAGFGFLIGLSTPSDKINDVYNNEKLNDSTSFIRKGVKSGYHLAVKARFPMSDNVTFYGGLGYHKFPQSDISVIDPKNPTKVLTTLHTTQSVVPISAGINFYLLKTFISPYIVGDLAYNYISSSVDYDSSLLPVPLPISSSPTDSRVGFGLGAGIDFSVGLFQLNLEGKYNYINLIGKGSGEDPKNYFALSLGIYF